MSVSESLIYRLPPNDRTMDNMIHAVTAIRGHLEGGPTILRPKQIEIVHSVADIIGSGERAAYLDLPTGIGKTVIFSQIVDAIQQDGHRKKILIVTDSQDLVLQTKERFKQHAPNVPVGMYYEKVKQTEQPVIVTTYDSFPYFAKNHAHEFDYVVFDEAHKALSEARIVHRHKFDNAVWLALTATPAYSKDKALENHFALAYKMSVREAVFNGLICQYRNIRVDSRYADLSKVKISPKGNYDKYSLEQEINIYSRNRSAVEFYQYAVDPYTGIPFLGKKGIANCAGIKHAYDFADLCQELIEPHMIGGKTPCVAIHGKSKAYPEMTPRFRKEILEAHRHNEIALLSQSDLLIHGHDDKEIELALNLAPSLSLVEVQQRAGRSLRIDENNPDKVATIADFIDEETDEREKALMYGDVVGQASVLFPETEKRFFATYGGGVSGGGGRRAIQHIDHGFLKKLKVLWSSEEVDAVILKNKLKGRKPDDEMSASEIAAEEKLDSRLVSKCLKELVPLKGKKGEYIDPTDTSKKPVIYHGGERIVTNGQKKRCLKREDVPKFIENCVFKRQKTRR